MTNSEKAMVFGATTVAGLLIVGAFLFQVGPSDEVTAELPIALPVEKPP